VEFLGAIARLDQTSPLPLPQVAVAGRSNVGKSSLVNSLLGRKRLARVSKRPGKTREINLYRVNDFILADLPGYGYARVPAPVREAWRDLVEGYLSTTAEIRGVLALIDARRGATPDDLKLVEFLAGTGTPLLFVITKFDKIVRSRRSGTIRAIEEQLGVSEEQVLATSARTREGIDALLDSIDALIQPESIGSAQ
jgi:GTP-binding protein